MRPASTNINSCRVTLGEVLAWRRRGGSVHQRVHALSRAARTHARSASGVALPGLCCRCQTTRKVPEAAHITAVAAHTSCGVPPAAMASAVARHKSLRNRKEQKSGSFISLGRSAKRSCFLQVCCLSFCVNDRCAPDRSGASRGPKQQHLVPACSTQIRVGFGCRGVAFCSSRGCFDRHVGRCRPDLARLRACRQEGGGCNDRPRGRPVREERSRGTPVPDSASSAGGFSAREPQLGARARAAPLATMQGHRCVTQLGCVHLRDPVSVAGKRARRPKGTSSKNQPQSAPSSSCLGVQWHR